MDPTEPSDLPSLLAGVERALGQLLDALDADWQAQGITEPVARLAITACVLRAHAMAARPQDWHWQQLSDRIALEVAGRVDWWRDDLDALTSDQDHDERF